MARDAGQWLLAGWFALIISMMFRWFGEVIGESESGTYNQQVDRSFRLGMMWFIFSEVMFFAVFFGALFYARQLSLPWLGGEGTNFLTNLLLWPGFENDLADQRSGGHRRRLRDHGCLGHTGAEHRDSAHQRRDHHDRPPRAESRQPRHR